MPSTDYTSPGNYSWTAPFACRNVTATVIGGGGSGYKDCDGDRQGGGGGGGGFARGTRQVPGGTVLSIKVGSGGGSLSCNSRSGGSGGSSRVQGGTLSVNATGGAPGYDDAGGGSAGGADAGDITRNGQRGEDDDDGGKGGGAGNIGGNSGRCGGSRAGGRGTSLSGGSGSCGGGKNGGSYGGGGGGNKDGDSGGRGANGAARIEWDYFPPQISSFTASTQYSLGGTPRDDVILSWATQYTTSVSINQGVGAVALSDPSKPVNTGLTSNASGSSPAQKIYTLTATGPGGSITATATALVKNDNKPSNSWTTTFTNLEPNTSIPKLLGVLSGVDMPTIISSPNSGVFFSNGASGAYANPKTFTNGQSVYIKMTTLPFNTDVSGETGAFGKTNTKTVTVVPGGGSSFNVSYVTRKPRIREDFDYDGQAAEYPYEDIDLISNTPTSTLVTQTLNMNDIEIDMEIKTDDPNVQIKINSGSWKNIREI